MRYEIALSPDLGVSVGEFVSGWSSSEAGQAISPARVANSEQDIYDPEALEGGIAILEDVGRNVDRHQLYQAIEQVLSSRGTQGELTHTPIEQPDGSVLLAVSYAADKDDR